MIRFFSCSTQLTPENLEQFLREGGDATYATLEEAQQMDRTIYDAEEIKQIAYYSIEVKRLA